MSGDRWCREFCLIPPSRSGRGLSPPATSTIFVYHSQGIPPTGEQDVSSFSFTCPLLLCLSISLFFSPLFSLSSPTFSLHPSFLSPLFLSTPLLPSPQEIHQDKNTVFSRSRHPPCEKGFGYTSFSFDSVSLSSEERVSQSSPDQ